MIVSRGIFVLEEMPESAKGYRSRTIDARVPSVTY